MKAAKQSKQRPRCVHLIENWGEVKRGDAEKTVILDYKDFLSWGNVELNRKWQGVSIVRRLFAFSTRGGQEHKSHSKNWKYDVMTPGNIYIFYFNLFVP